MDRDKSKLVAGFDLSTEAVPAAALWLIGADGARSTGRWTVRAGACCGNSSPRARLDEVFFEAGVFVAKYPNRNYLRFRDEDLEAFAASFKGQPFLRDHNAWELDAWGGIIRDSRLEGREIVQRIALTVPRDIEAFLNGVIDRFSVSWYWTPPLCSVCGNEWMGRDCAHWPGVKYPGDTPAPAPGGAAVGAGVKSPGHKYGAGENGKSPDLLRRSGQGERSKCCASCCSSSRAARKRLR